MPIHNSFMLETYKAMIERSSSTLLKQCFLHEFNVNVRNSWGWCPLFHAIWMNKPTAVEVLLDNGANVLYRTSYVPSVYWFARHMMLDGCAEKILKHIRSADLIEEMEKITAPSSFTGEARLPLQEWSSYIAEKLRKDALV